MNELVGKAGVFTIASGQTVSAALDLGDKTLVGLQMPSAFTGVALTFQASFDGTTYATVVDDTGGSLTYTVAASTYIVIHPTTFAGIKKLKVVSGTAEGADREIVAIGRHCS